MDMTAPAPAQIPNGHARLGPYLPLLPLLRREGVDAPGLLARVGIAPDSFDCGDRVLPLAQIGALFRQCERTLDCAHLGLMVGGRSHLPALGLLSDLAQGERTLGAALEQITANLHLDDRGAEPIWMVYPDSVRMGYMVTEPQVPHGFMIEDLAMAIAVNLVRGFCGPHWNPREVMLAHRPPPNPAPYQQHFRCRLTFNAEYSALVFSPHILSLPLEARASPVSVPDAPVSVRQQVERILPELLLERCCSIDAVSTRLGLARRTLNRRLEGEETSFRALLDGFRLVRSQYLLQNTSLSVGEIAYQLGYNEMSSFTRAFRRQVGMAPVQWRK